MDDALPTDEDALELAQYLVETNRGTEPGFRIPRDDDPPLQVQFERP